MNDNKGMSAVAGLASSLAQNLKPVISAMSGLGKIIGKGLMSTMRGLTGMLSVLGDVFGKIGGALMKSLGAVAGVVGALILGIYKLITTIDLANYREAKNLGVSAPELEGKKFAFKQLGVDEGMVTRIVSAINAAKLDPSKMGTLVKLGVTNVQGRDSLEVFDEVIKKLGSGEINQKIAFDVFNELGASLEGSGQLLDKSFANRAKNLENEYKKTRPLSDKQLGAAQEFQTKMALVTASLGHLFQSIALKFQPILLQLANKILAFVQSPVFDKLVTKIQEFATNLIQMLPDFLGDKKGDNKGTANFMDDLMAVVHGIVGTLTVLWNVFMIIVDVIKLVAASFLQIIPAVKMMLGKIPGLTKYVGTEEENKAQMAAIGEWGSEAGRSIGERANVIGGEMGKAWTAMTTSNKQTNSNTSNENSSSKQINNSTNTANNVSNTRRTRQNTSSTASANLDKSLSNSATQASYTLSTQGLSN